jgi:class 3 adenylate cyclase
MENKTRLAPDGSELPAPSAAPDLLSSMRRRLISSLHDDLLPLAEALDGYCQILVDAAQNCPDEFRETASKMLVAAHEFYVLARDQMTPSRWEVALPQFDERLRVVRHDLGNRLSQVHGNCQLLIMDQEEGLVGAPVEDLKKIMQLCDDGKTVLQRYKGTGEQSLQEAGFGQDTGAEATATDGMDVAVASCSPRPAVEPATILVADDSPSSRDILVRILEREGHVVEVASNGREALEILAEREFDLVLLDFIMPEMNGYTTLQHIKSDERLRHTPVIIVSALDTVHEVVACIEIGAEDFLTKPVHLPLLRARTSACLERKRLREREFGQFFTPELARHLVRHPELLREGREANVSILFCDIRGFSRTSELLGPSDTVNWLSDVMAALSDCVINHCGVLVDYIGDELMAMWGAPEQQEHHADLACRAALDMLARMPALSAKWEPIVGRATEVGIGINTGIARVGNTGSHRKFKFGPLGNPVNLASRVQGATKHLGADLLITENTMQHLHEHFVTRRLCKVRVVNIDRPVDLHEIRPDESAEFISLKERYEHALGEFEKQEFRVAASVLGPLLVEYPHDGPSLILMSRVIDRLLHKTDAFDPAWELSSK